MKFAYFDIETNGLLDTVSDFHIGVINLSTQHIDHNIYIGKAQEFVDNLKRFTDQGYYLVGHNIIRYDIPALEKLTGENLSSLKSHCIDTLSLSWHIMTERAENNQSFGLESFGEMFGIPKPEIESWEGLSFEEYLHRCKEDVKITRKLMERLMVRCAVLYPNESEFLRYVNYLNFKMDCLAYQEKAKFKVNTFLAESCKIAVDKYYETKKSSLEDILPKKKKYSTTNLPNKITTVNGEFTSHAKKYITEFFKPDSLISSDKTLKFVSGELPSNAGSHSQIKEYLFSLGWKPDTFKTNTKGELVPQISNEDREISESVKNLYSIEPRLENLEGMYMLSHRSGIFKGFIENSKNGKIEPSARGFTSTLRLKHMNIVNLPSVHKPWGDKIRACLTADGANKILIGCDMVALEDVTKQHYMYFFDPEYVKTMQNKDFDPHLDLAVKAGFLTQEQADAHKAKTEDYTEIRQRAKRANYACTYGAGPPKLSSSIGISLDEATTLHKAYWDRNSAITDVCNSVSKKTLQDGSIWVKNPVSKFWMPLRSEKDIFSSINQSTGVYVFDRFIFHLRKQGSHPIFQYHDEIVLEVNKWEVDDTYQKLDKAIEKVNEEVKLNVTLRIDYKKGNNYAEIH